MPFFSVILPTYNRAEFIGKAISSVLSQSYTDFELIVIDDGSTDNTSEIVGSFPDERIKYCFQKNQERSVARNNGIERSIGKYICFLDSDDQYLPNHLSVLFEHIKMNEYPVALFHTYQKYVRNGKEVPAEYNDAFREEGISKRDSSLINNVWSFSPAVQTIAVHRDIISTISFDSYPIPFECYDFIGRVAAMYDVIKIKETTVVMQLHENNSTGYDLKFLETARMAFMYILSNPIYDNIKNNFSVKNKFYSIYIGLSDCYARAGNKAAAIKYLFKGLSYKTDIKNIRQLFGIMKNLITK